MSCASTAALASRSHWTTETWPLKAASSSGVQPWELRLEGQAAGKTQRNARGEKSKFWKLWPLKLLTMLKEHCMFEAHRVGWKTYSTYCLLNSIEAVFALLAVNTAYIDWKYIYKSACETPHIVRKQSSIPLTCLFAPVLHVGGRR